VQTILSAFARSCAGDPQALGEARQDWSGLPSEQQALLADLGRLLATPDGRSVALAEVLGALALGDLDAARRGYTALTPEEQTLVGAIGRYIADHREATMPLLGAFDGVGRGEDTSLRRPARRNGIRTEATPEQLLGRLGLKAFRPAQREAVQAALDGRDALIVMPTGGGKSLCYQLPALASDALTVVVSPLIALITDQHHRLLDAGQRSVMLAATVGDEGNARALAEIRSGDAQIVFCAPERFASAALRAALLQRDIALFVVDEAHCVSEWGHDFRPDYLRLAATIDLLGRPPVMACTATATPKVADEIVARLGLRDPLVVRRGFDRPNITFDVVPLEGTGAVARKRGYLLGGLADPAQRPAIVYCGTRRDSEAVGQLLRDHGHAAAVYHAGLSPQERHCAQEAFMTGQVEVVVATNAFGQGIDKGDIRSVWHWALPTSVEGYYQEAGRAGRDGAPAHAVLLAMRGDLGRLIQFIKRSEITVEQVEEVVAGARQAARDGVAEIDPGQQEDRQRIALAVAERAGALALAPARRGRVAVRLTGRLDRGAVIAACREATDRRWEAYKALKAFADDATTCRRRQLLDHFGDHEPAHPVVRCCDVCDPAELPIVELTARRSGVARDTAPGPPVDATELEALKRWRAQRAAGKPAYTVATNAVLEEVIRRRPSTPDELLAIKGIGSGFLANHGEDLLATMRGAAAA
jgi:ATP-dependent DNA helicase RecQ